MIPSVEMGKKVTDNYDIIPNDVKEKTVSYDSLEQLMTTADDITS